MEYDWYSTSFGTLIILITFSHNISDKKTPDGGGGNKYSSLEGILKDLCIYTIIALEYDWYISSFGFITIFLTFSHNISDK